MNKIIESDMASIINRFPYAEELKDKTILVTGANGLIACNFVYFLLELNKKCNTNIKVVALVRTPEKAQRLFKNYWFVL